MTKQEAIDYLNTIVPEQVNMVVLDAAKWEAFKTSMLGFLNDPTVDLKYKMAIEEISDIVTSTLL